MKRRLIAITAIAVAASLGVVSVAEAHTLPAKVAQKAARKLGKKVAQEFVDQYPSASPASYQVDRCSRRTAHRLVCRLHVYGTDSATGQDYDCHAYIIVQASKYDYTYTTKLTGTRC